MGRFGLKLTRRHFTRLAFCADLGYTSLTMTKETARQILHALLTEKGIRVLDRQSEHGAVASAVAAKRLTDEDSNDAAIRLLLERSLSTDASGALSDELARALAGIYDAVAAAAEDALEKQV